MKKSLFIIAVLVGVLVSKTQAQNYQVHTLYMYSFTKYVKWPASYSDGDFVIAVVGNSGIVSHLKKMASLKKVGNRLIRVVEYASADDIQKCNMVFLSNRNNAEFEALKGKLSGSHTLILTESAGMGKKGSAINFIIKQKKLLFELNQSVIDEAGLQISQDLVKFAIMI